MSVFANRSFRRVPGRRVFLSCSLLLFFGFGGAAGGIQAGKEAFRQEETEDYYRKWLNEDVIYIITDEERAVFENLATAEEKERFIEQFWRRRDPDPETPHNEFREEHYRRLAYANDHFSVGAPGWKTDRGRIYILHGPPDSIEYHDQGEQYYRTAHEGGGNTTTYAWQRWWYRHLPGIGDDVDVEFVDKTMTGHFTLARDEMDKDAMLWVPGMGLTISDKFLPGSKAERIGTRFMANVATRRAANPLKIFTRKDDLFERLRRYAKLQAAPDIKFKDLESLVDLRIYYDQLPFRLRHDLIRITSEDYLVPVTFYFSTEEFTFQDLGSVRHARLNVYGRVESLGKEKVYAFDDLVDLYLEPDRKVAHSLWQRAIPLKPGRYKLVAVVRDTHSAKVGTLEHGIVVPREEGSELDLSPLILADRIQPATGGEFINDPFILTSLKVYPNPDNVFLRGRPLGFYFEVYNVAADQQTLEAALSFRIKIERNGVEIPTPFQNKDLKDLLHRYSDRFFAGSIFNTAPLDPGRYRLTVTVIDHVAGSERSRSADFQILDPSLASNRGVP